MLVPKPLLLNLTRVVGITPSSDITIKVILQAELFNDSFLPGLAQSQPVRLFSIKQYRASLKRWRAPAPLSRLN